MSLANYPSYLCHASHSGSGIPYSREGDESIKSREGSEMKNSPSEDTRVCVCDSRLEKWLNLTSSPVYLQEMHHKANQGIIVKNLSLMSQEHQSQFWDASFLALSFLGCIDSKAFALTDKSTGKLLFAGGWPRSEPRRIEHGRISNVFNRVNNGWVCHQQTWEDTYWFPRLILLDKRLHRKKKEQNQEE